jgi:hypothetical protein
MVCKTAQILDVNCREANIVVIECQESALDICLGPRREPSFNEKFDSVLQKRAVARRVQREGRA